MRRISLVILLQCSICILLAQPPTIEQLVKKHHDAITKATKITPAQLTKVDDVYKQFFTKIISSQKGKQAGMGNRPPMLPKEEIDKLVAERNKKLKSFLNDAQYKAVLEVDEKLRPKTGGKEEERRPPPPNQ